MLYTYVGTMYFFTTSVMFSQNLMLMKMSQHYVMFLKFSYGIYSS